MSLPKQTEEMSRPKTGVLRSIESCSFVSDSKVML